MVLYEKEGLFFLQTELTNGLRMSETLDDLLVRCNPLDNLGVLLHVLPQLGHDLDLLVVGLGLGLALGLQSLDDVLILPADLVRQTAQSAVLKSRPEPRKFR